MKKNKQQPMFNRRCVSTNCYHFLQCLKLTQKWQWVSKITCTPKEDRGGGGVCKVLEVQQTCSWVYLIFKRTHVVWHVGLPLTVRKGRFNSQWCLRFVQILTADSWNKVSLFSNITEKKKVSTKTSKTVVDLVMHNGEAVGASKPMKPTNAPSERRQASLCNICAKP